MNRSWFLAGVLALCALGGLTSSANAGSVDLDTRRVATGLNRPVYVTAPPGDTDRLFIVQQSGAIRILNLADLTINPVPFLNIASLTTGGTSGGDERGLLGLAFDPDYDVNGHFYVHYYGSSQTRVRRYTVSADPDVADASSGLQILAVSQPQGNHNGGQIEFSPIDGYLYIGIGDGGNFNDTGSGHAPGGNGQSLNTLLGKILRIDVSNSAPGDLYDIPADNPFVGIAGLDEIWSYGLRNPYRFGFDRDTGDMWIGDVGQDAEEEINFEPTGMGGLNYGWRCMEGDNCSGLSGCTCFSAGLTLPVSVYSHGLGCSVTGGRIFRGDSMPSMQGTYFFADYCSSRIWSGTLNGAGTALENFQQRLPGELAPPPGNGSINSISGFGEDGYGDIYICDLNGELFKIVPENIDELDCNGNFIVDSLEGLAAGVDCNSNGIDDACEIATGQAEDCNSNGIPDECDVATGVLEDCDGNGLADACETAAGTAIDCNSNGIPDSCDIASGVLPDTNDDGFADNCDFDVIQALDASGVAGGAAIHTMAGTFTMPMAGFSVAFEFDPAILAATELSVDNTAAAGADFVAPNFDNVAGWGTLGVVMDFSPPIDNTIPAGLSTPLFETSFNVDAGAALGASLITPVPSEGNPTVETILSTPAGTSLVPFLVAGEFSVVAGTPFVRGDANDDGNFDIADPVYVLAFLFSSGPDLNCGDSGDANDDGVLDIADPVYSLSNLFTGGPAPVAPHPGCGIDPTDDALSCDAFSNCP